jgi:selenocysteine-specific translation elongation factor
MKSQGKNVRRAALATCVFVLAFAGIAVAETTRDEYKAQVEPICRTNKQESERFLKGVKTMVRKDKLKQAGAAFLKAAKALERAEKQLALVPQPAADSAKLGKWLSDIKGEAALMKRIAAKFKAGNKSKGSSLSVKLTHNATVANNLVIAFQFHFCKIDPSKFS